MNNSTSRQLETEVLSLLEANPTKKYRCHELSKRFEVTKDMMARTMERLAGRNLVAVDHPHGGKHYSYKEAGPAEEQLPFEKEGRPSRHQWLRHLPETRTFIQKPHKFDQAMIDRMNQIKADRVTLPSKTNTDDAGELSEMDKNKLRMMGSGN